MKLPYVSISVTRCYRSAREMDISDIFRDGIKLEDLKEINRQIVEVACQSVSNAITLQRIRCFRCAPPNIVRFGKYQCTSKCVDPGSTIKVKCSSDHKLELKYISHDGKTATVAGVASASASHKTPPDIELSSTQAPPVVEISGERHKISDSAVNLPIMATAEQANGLASRIAILVAWHVAQLWQSSWRIVTVLRTGWIFSREGRALAKLFNV